MKDNWDEEIIDKTLEHTLAFMNVLIVKLKATKKVRAKEFGEGPWSEAFQDGYETALAVVEDFIATGKNVASLMKEKHLELLNAATAIENLEGEVLTGKKKKD